MHGHPFILMVDCCFWVAVGLINNTFDEFPGDAACVEATTVGHPFLVIVALGLIVFYDTRGVIVGCGMPCHAINPQWSLLTANPMGIPNRQLLPLVALAFLAVDVAHDGGSR